MNATLFKKNIPYYKFIFKVMLKVEYLKMKAAYKSFLW